MRRTLGMVALAGAALLVPMLAPTPSLAAPPEPVQQHNSDAVWFENWIGLSNATMRIIAPDGRVETIFAETGTPVYRLSRGRVVDGVYRFELRAATDEEVRIVNPVDTGRGDAARDTMRKPFILTGSFVVSRNVIITPEEIREE